MMDDLRDPLAVASRSDLSGFVDELRANLAAAAYEWENPTLDRFLEAFAAYTRDVPGSLHNVRSDVDPERPSWQLFALVLAGARIYE
jgi:hypothetical protein